jgi:PAS domain S-box-containing protein
VYLHLSYGSHQVVNGVQETADMDANLRPSGIEGLGDMSWGTHVCLFYETKEDLLDFFIPFFKAGLEHHEFCLCVASEPLMAEEAERAMRQAIPDFERYVVEGQLEITPHTDWYLKDGYFDAERVLQGWIDKLDQAFAKGFSGLRFAANILLEKRDWENFAQYEGKLEESLHGLQIEGLCAYRLSRYSAANLLDVIRHHQFTLARQDGTWEPLEGTQLKRAHAEVLKLNAALEQRVAERAAELATANEQLRREITERNQSEARLQAAIEAADIVLWERDLLSGQITWLGHHEKLLGFGPGELNDNTLASFEKRIHPEDIEELRQIRQRALEERSEYGHEYRVVWRDSSIHWIRAQGRFIYNEAGQPVRLYGAVLDITERKQAEATIRKSEQVLREAESLGHTGSWEHDLVTGDIFNTEENLRLFFGDDNSKGENFEDYSQVVHPDDREYVLHRRAELLEEEGPSDIEYRVVWPDGSVHVIFGRATVVRDELGQPIRVYGTNVDITERKRAEDAARESEKLLLLVLDTLPVGVAVTDLTDNIIIANPASKRIWGDVIISGSERRERSIGFWHDSGKRIAPEEWASLRALSKGETSLNELIDIETFDGVHKIIRNSSAPIRNSEGIIVGAVFVNEDVTERKRAEEETKHQAARAETLARIAARLNQQLDLDTVVHAICQEVVDTFKVSQATISLYDPKRDLLDYAGGVNVPPKYATKIEPISRARFDEFVRTMGPIIVVPDIQALPNVPNAEFSAELDVRTVVTADVRRDHELIGVLVLGVNGQVREFDQDQLSLLKAISDQAAIAIANALLLKKANEQHEQLRALSTRLVQVQETERRSLTTELHDRVGQNLTGLSILLQNIKGLLSEEAAKILAAEFDDAQILVQDTTRHIRDIMAELYLPELEDHGLAAALEIYAERAASRGNLDLIADLPDTTLSLSLDVRVALFRATQEAISNVLKHADATQLEISLERENGRVRLSVEDNGQGFEPGATSQKETPSWGLKIMRERIESIGGTVEIESEPGQGTRVTFEIERFS